MRWTGSEHDGAWRSQLASRVGRLSRTASVTCATASSSAGRYGATGGVVDALRTRSGADLLLKRLSSAAMQGATNSDFTRDLIHPKQMIRGRLLVPGSAHATPIANLYLCGASCHPGPGVTFLPGYGAAYEVVEALGAVPRSAARSAA